MGFAAKKLWKSGASTRKWNKQQISFFFFKHDAFSQMRTNEIKTDSMVVA
jgi:hypothetical protein